jgi:flagellar biogenesis protein FliO
MYILGRFAAVCAADPAEPVADAAGKTAEPFRDAAGTLMVGVVLFLLAIYIIYILYKHLLSKRSIPGLGFIKGRAARMMTVIEITPVGPGSTIQLVRIADEYFLIGVTKNQITFLTKTGYGPLQEDTANVSEGEGKEPVFERYLNRLFKKNKPEEKAPAGTPSSDDGNEGGGGEGNEDET